MKIRKGFRSIDNRLFHIKPFLSEKKNHIELDKFSWRVLTKIGSDVEIFLVVFSIAAENIVKYYSRTRAGIFFVYSVENQNYLWYQIASVYAYDTIEEYNKFMCSKK